MNNNTGQHMAQQAQRFAEMTIKLVIQGHIQMAKKCMHTADEIFSKSNEEIKNIIRGIYTCSVSGFTKMHHCSVKHLLPEILQREYLQRKTYRHVHMAK